MEVIQQFKTERRNNGYEFGVTRNRIRQIEQKALLKLRRHPEMRQLYEFLDDLN